MPEYQPSRAAARSVAAGAVDQPEHVVEQELLAGLRPSRVAACHPAGAVLFIQRQRDLAEGTTVEFTEDDVAYGGTVKKRRTAEVGKVKYTVKDGTGQLHEVYADEVVPIGLAEPLEEGEILQDGAKVKATVGWDELDCVVTRSVVEPPEQFYDINVEWDGSQRLPEPYRMEVPERRVRAKQLAALPVKKLDKAKITHFYPKRQGKPNAGEYVRPGGPIDITRHALGSGVYGITEPGQVAHSAAAAHDGANQTQTYDVEIIRPLVVQDARHSGDLQQLGKKINGMAQALHDERKELAGGKVDFQGMIIASIKRNDASLRDLLDRVFGRAGLQAPDLGLVHEALVRFFARYDAPDSKFVDQPTTIFLAELYGFGGIYGDTASGLNAFDMGNVAFVPPRQDFPRKARTGTQHGFVA